MPASSVRHPLVVLVWLLPPEYLYRVKSDEPHPDSRAALRARRLEASLAVATHWLRERWSAFDAPLHGDTVLRLATTEDLAALQVYVDVLMRRDYYMTPKQLRDAVTRHETYVLAIDGILIAIAIVCGQGTLVNLVVHPLARGLGLGRVILNALELHRIRVKTNQSTGDPTGFYTRCGWHLTIRDPHRPHIAECSPDAPRHPENSP
jgi:GNAT superfamily N-acetyltransferase